jgi:hypothetical protein
MKIFDQPIIQKVEEIKHRFNKEPEKHLSDCLSLIPNESAILKHIVYKGWHSNEIDTYIPKGTTSLIYFWTDKNINMCHWIGPDNKSIGCFFNACTDTVISSSSVIWWDLWLDCFISSKGDFLMLDEDEVPNALDPELKQKVENAHHELCHSAIDLAKSVFI